MSEPFIGEIRMTAITFAPKDWAFCDGQYLSINQHQALFALLGTQFGGNGRTNFALPDFRGRTPLGEGTYVSYSGGPQIPYNTGMFGGQTEVTLSLNELPNHTHNFEGSTDFATLNPPKDGAVLANSQLGTEVYRTDDYSASYLTELSSATSSPYGAGLAHNNLQPTSTVNFIISLTGLFPSRN